MRLDNRPLPTVSEDSEQFWASAKARALELQKCDTCGEFRYYPGSICHFCGSDAFTWTAIAGTGTIYSYTRLERAKGNPFENDTPIPIALRLDRDGEIGQRVTITYGDIDDHITLPLFTPAS